jgi:hypothetical protein
MSEYQRFERKSLEGMADVDGWGQTPLAERKKVIKAVWQHLNKKTESRSASVKREQEHYHPRTSRKESGGRLMC